MRKLIEKCPSCSYSLSITECRCPNCRLELRGEFQPGPFSSLSDDQATFVRIFIRARGNLSEVEKVLGISYPTIRNKLDEIIRALDASDAAAAAPAPQVEPESQNVSGSSDKARRAILARVAAGEMTSAEALEELKLAQ